MLTVFESCAARSYEILTIEKLTDDPQEAGLQIEQAAMELEQDRTDTRNRILRQALVEIAVRVPGAQRVVAGRIARRRELRLHR